MARVYRAVRQSCDPLRGLWVRDARGVTNPRSTPIADDLGSGRLGLENRRAYADKDNARHGKNKNRSGTRLELFFSRD